MNCCALASQGERSGSPLMVGGFGEFLMSKSYVTMEQAQCPVCCKVFDTGAILIDRRLKERFESKTITGLSLCLECETKHKDGYVALIAVTNGEDGLKLGNEDRTGKIAHIKREVFGKIFNVPAPDGAIAFCEPEVIEKLKKMAPKTED